ncbi:hypothetical protein LSTR_LSTR009107 [Laodelphax striatellus]|nr:hypothetical protein LSTR_LSTR009107 [Laodelphax striatellus]
MHLLKMDSQCHVNSQSTSLYAVRYALSKQPQPFPHRQHSSHHTELPFPPFSTQFPRALHKRSSKDSRLYYCRYRYATTLAKRLELLGHVTVDNLAIFVL